MQAFSIVDPKQSINRPYFLEASAGTGKTFTIEHLVVRLLIETTPPISIDQILVVTFTKKATRELKARIRANIEHALDALRSNIPSWPYLQLVGDERSAIFRLEQALLRFDEAKIFTIHSFCHEMLRQQMWHGQPLHTFSYEEQLQVVRDFFRIGLSETLVSPGQLGLVVEEQLAQKVLRKLGKLAGLPFADYHAQFIAIMARLSQALTTEGVLADFFALSSCYTGICDRSGQVKSQVLENTEFFARLLAQSEWTAEDFDYLIVNGLLLFDLMAQGKQKVRAKWPERLIHPQMLQAIEELGLLLQRARDRDLILGTLATACHKMLEQAMAQKGAITFDGMLAQMAQLVQQEPCRGAIQQQFAAAIVDEFQDTDLKQWEIFRTLFTDGRPFFVVGDPKQSIYAFRTADVYCYLNALEVMGAQNCRTLQTNYRSRPQLVTQLNDLFCQEGWLPLPEQETELSCGPVAAGKTQDNALSSEGAITYFVAEGKAATKSARFPSSQMECESFFPFIAREMVRLGLPWSSYAVLIADRYQGRRLQSYLKQCGIPAIAARGQPFTDSVAPGALAEVVDAVDEPNNFSKLRRALGGPILGWSAKQLAALEDVRQEVDVICQFYRLREQLLRKGMAHFFSQLLVMRWDDRSVAERLLSRRQRDLLVELRQVVAQVADLRHVDRILIALQELSQGRGGDDAPVLRAVHDDAAVQLLTIYASKGLEYDVVFALGLANRTPAPRQRCEELDAEKGRLFYVALTRAKDRVYVPIALDPDGVPPNLGSASPVELFFARRGKPSLLHEEAYASVPLRQIPDLARHTAIRLGKEQLPEPVPSESVSLVRPPNRTINVPIRWLQSFSSLVPAHSAQLNRTPPTNYAAEEKTLERLPAGPDTGTVLHELLERLPFFIPKDPNELLAYVDLRTTRLKGWEGAVAQLLFRTLTQPLDGFCLGEVANSQVLREMEFLFSADQLQSINGVKIHDGCLVGVIDLVFLYKSKYYLLDWKSNWLPNYHHETLEQAMSQWHYQLQASIYKAALKRYLSVIDARPFPELFGGTYYLFLRGLNGTRDGVYFDSSAEGLS